MSSVLFLLITRRILVVHLPERIIRNLQIIALDKTVHFSADL